MHHIAYCASHCLCGGRGHILPALSLVEIRDFVLSLHIILVFRHLACQILVSHQRICSAFLPSLLIGVVTGQLETFSSQEVEEPEYQCDLSVSQRQGCF